MGLQQRRGCGEESPGIKHPRTRH